MATEAPPAPPPSSASRGLAGIRSPDPSQMGKAPPKPTSSTGIPVPDDLDTQPNADRVASLKAAFNPEEKPAPKPTEDPERPGNQDPEQKGDDVPPAPDPNAEQPKASNPAPDKRKNPWKLLDEEKKVRGTLEAEVQRLKSERVPDQERTSLTDRVTKAEARAKELEDHIRYLDYQKHPEFTEKFDAPYVSAWTAATQELIEVPILDPHTGQAFAGTMQEKAAFLQNQLSALAGMGLGDAKAKAKEWFGEDFQEDAMRHRNILRDLSGKRQTALDEARTKGGERAKQESERMATESKKTEAEISKIAKEIHDQVMADANISPDFKAKVIPEGKQPTPEEKAWNAAHQRGVDQASKYFRADPAKAKTPEQRREIIENQFAIVARSVGFGPMKLERNQLRKENTELKKRLEAYEDTAPAPPGGGGRSNGAGKPSEDAYDSFERNLRKRSQAA